MSAHKFNCPACGLLLKLPGVSPGKKGKCPHCGGIFAVPEPAARAPGDPPVKKAAATLPGVGPRPAEEKKPASPPTAVPAIRKTAPTFPGIHLPAEEVHFRDIPDKPPPPQPPRIACPACKGMLRPPPDVPPGKSIRCPRCSAVFPLPAETKANGPLVAKPPAAPTEPTAVNDAAPKDITPTPAAGQLPRLACPSCGAQLKRPSGLAPGRRLQCPHCQLAFPLPAEVKADMEPRPATTDTAASPETAPSEAHVSPTTGAAAALSAPAADTPAPEQAAEAPAEPTASQPARQVAKVTCPECGARLKLARPVSVGAKITCVKCSAAFAVPDIESGTAAKAAADPIEPSPAAQSSADVTDAASADEEVTKSPSSGPGKPISRALAWSLAAVAGGLFLGALVFLGLVESGVFEQKSAAVRTIASRPRSTERTQPFNPDGAAPLGAWGGFTSKEGGFTLDIPGKPKETTRKEPQGNLQHNFAVQSDDGLLAYQISYIDLVNESLDGPTAVLNRLAQSNDKSQVLDRRELLANGYPGVEITSEFPRNDTPMVMIIRAYLVKNRFYRLSAFSPKDRKQEADLLRFLDSFKVQEPPLSVEQRAAYDQERKVLKAIRDQRVDVRLRRAGESLHVELAGNQVKDDHLSLLPTLNRMTFLRLQKTPITDAGLEHLRGLPGLAELDLRTTAIGDNGLKHLKGLTGLKTLGLNGTQVTNAGLIHLAALPQLKNLGLGDNPRLTDAGLANLAKCSKISQLILDHTGISDAGLEYLRALKELAELDLRDCKVGDAGMAYLDELPKLAVLRLNGTQVTDAGVKLLLKNHPQLRIER